jgi:hypothetical protein
MKTKLTNKDKRRILNYFQLKLDEYSALPKEEFEKIATDGYKHNNKKLSSTEIIAWEKVNNLNQIPKTEETNEEVQIN